MPPFHIVVWVGPVSHVYFVLVLVLAFGPNAHASSFDLVHSHIHLIHLILLLQARGSPRRARTRGARSDGLGLPLFIGSTLWTHRAAMRRDVTLWQRGVGDTAETNPDYWVRRRYSRLYIDYKPHVHWWRLVLVVRKGSLVGVSVNRAAAYPLLTTALGACTRNCMWFGLVLI